MIRHAALTIILITVVSCSPKWENDDPEVRLMAVRELADEDILYQIALLDSSPQVRNEALHRIQSLEVLMGLAIQSKFETIQTNSVNRITDEIILREIAAKSNDENVGLLALEKLSLQDSFVLVATNSNCTQVRFLAIDKLTNQSLLEHIIINHSQNKISIWSFNKLTSPESFARIALESDNARRRELAVQRTSDQAVLGRIATGQDDEDVKLAAVCKLHNQAILENLAINDASENIRQAAIGNLTSKTLLRKIIEQETNEQCQDAAIDALFETRTIDGDDIKRMSKMAQTHRSVGRGLKGLNGRSIKDVLVSHLSTWSSNKNPQGWISAKAIRKRLKGNNSRQLCIVDYIITPKGLLSPDCPESFVVPDVYMLYAEEGNLTAVSSELDVFDPQLIKYETDVIEVAKQSLREKGVDEYKGTVFGGAILVVSPNRIAMGDKEISHAFSAFFSRESDLYSNPNNSISYTIAYMKHPFRMYQRRRLSHEKIIGSVFSHSSTLVSNGLQSDVIPVVYDGPDAVVESVKDSEAGLSVELSNGGGTHDRLLATTVATYGCDFLVKAGDIIGLRTQVITKSILEQNTRSEVIKRLLNKYDVSLVIAPDGKGETAFTEAIKHDDLEAIKVLIEAGADPSEIRTKRGKTALHVAVQESSLEMCEYLLERDVQVDVFDSRGKTALRYAVENGDEEIVETLVSSGAKSWIRRNEFSLSASHIAVALGN